MKKPIEWTLSETFQFPASAGSVSEVNEVKVTAGYQDDQTEDAVRLSGIYHIAANVTLAEKAAGEAAEDPDGAIMIDDVEIEGTNGYFEYAVPLEVDLPAAHGARVTASVIDSTASATDSGDLLVMWTVQAVAETPEPAAPAPEVTAAAETAQKDAGQTAAAASAVQETDSEAGAAASAEALDQDSSSVALLAAVSEESGHHEMLAFIRDLEDGYSVTPFTLNDVFIEQK
ncbi:hypothetical protein NCCP2716_13040 [Sporosarcina sp. NCCP-2716]|uniref:hypothetical protein n=1 Tax=Sporosarcina sp. NCCP-2716 TaxID=2943679 RepID=UPI00203ADD1E|nr:hypothetical protein [Sporosarcina sp. NCCP-2716]GKV68806.1 hypothetical protein NCCP2716_13040 [Sporosarcina sp. NCCP-2716]